MISDTVKSSSNKSEKAIFGAGCFWCVEAIFQKLEGVEEVLPGYTGGHSSNPTYEEICTGNSGHVETCSISFDPKIISYSELLEVFWHVHDPTTPNRQGNDVGEQYKSAIFYTSELQKETALKSKSEVAPLIWEQEIVTEILPLDVFYAAEDYHHDYYNTNPNNGYCRAIITPKITKFKKKFANLLKSSD